MSVRIFRYQGLAVRCASSDPEVIEWLAEFLNPQFTVSDDSEWDWSVELIDDSARYQALRAEGTAGPEIDCFVLDSQVIQLPSWKTESSDPIAFDQQDGVFYVVRPDERTITLVCEKMHRRLRSRLMRVVRELGMEHVQERGDFFLHASCFAIGDDGFIITGPKNTGKTTLLTLALHSRSTSYVSNDRVLVSPGPEGVTLAGMPAIVNVRTPMLELMPGFGERLRSKRYHFRDLLRETEPSGTEPTNQRWSITPAQYCDVLDVTAVSTVRARGLVFPSVTNEPGTIDLRPISPQDAAERLIESLFGACDLRASTPTFGRETGFVPPDPARLAEQCSELTARVGCAVAELGLDAYRDDQSSDRFVELLRTLPTGDPAGSRA